MKKLTEAQMTRIIEGSLYLDPKDRDAYIRREAVRQSESASEHQYWADRQDAQDHATD